MHEHKKSIGLALLRTYARSGFQDYSQMNYQTAPHLASQHDLLSVSSETIPLYHLLPIKEEAALDQSCCHGDGSQLISLSGLLETAFDIQAETATTNTTFNHGNDGSSFSVTQGCPDKCPCVCHVPVPCTSFNQRRPSVIMTPVARRGKATSESCTHAPLKINQIGENLEMPFHIVPNQDVVISQEEQESNETMDVIPEKESNKRVEKVWKDTKDGKRFLRASIDGLETRFKLTEEDWEVMEIAHFPGGGRLLGGAWTTIFKRGLHESNPWCNLRLKNNHVRKENSRKIISAPFFRGSGNCKRRECNMKFKIVIEEERGKYVKVTYTGNVCHNHESYPTKK